MSDFGLSSTGRLLIYWSESSGGHWAGRGLESMMYEEMLGGLGLFTLEKAVGPLGLLSQPKRWFYSSVTFDRSFGCAVLPIRASTKLAGPHAEDELRVCLLSHRLLERLVLMEPNRAPSIPSALGKSRPSLPCNSVSYRLLDIQNCNSRHRRWWGCL